MNDRGEPDQKAPEDPGSNSKVGSDDPQRADLAIPRPKPKPRPEVQGETEVDAASSAAGDDPSEEPPVEGDARPIAPRPKPQEGPQGSEPREHGGWRERAEQQTVRPPRPAEAPSAPSSTAAGAKAEALRVIEEANSYLAQGYDLLGILGLAGTGKTHALAGFTHLLPQFEVGARERLQKRLKPEKTEAEPYLVAYGGQGERREDRTAFIDAGGELYIQLKENRWELKEESEALLHTLSRSSGLLFTVHLKPESFQHAAKTEDMSEAEQEFLKSVKEAQQDLDFVGHALIVLRAIRHHDGKLEPVIKACQKAGSIEEGLRFYQQESALLDVPVVILFTQADLMLRESFEVAPGESLALPNRPRGVAAFVARRLPTLYSEVSGHARRFHFDFAQSYVEVDRQRVGRKGPEFDPHWEEGDEPLSAGLLPALEFLFRNKPRKDRFGRLLQRCEIGTRTALRIHRLFHRELWGEVRP